jgi:hypothetical protein
MIHHRSLLSIVFISLAAQSVFTIAFVSPDKAPILNLLFPLLYLILSYKLLVLRLNGEEGKDYWDQGLDDSDQVAGKKIILLGNEVHSDLDEDAKEERFLRVASHNRAILRKIFIFIFLLSSFIGHYLSVKLLGDYWIIFHLLPISCGLIALLTTSYGQLTVLPLLNFSPSSSIIRILIYLSQRIFCHFMQFFTSQL